MGKDLKGRELGRNLFQRKDGRFEAKYTDNFGKRHSIYGTKLSDVRKMLNDALYKKEHGGYGNECKITFDDWFFIWIDNYKNRNIKETTLCRYIRYYNNNIKKYIGFMRLADIKQIHIQKLFNKVVDERRLAESTLKHLCALLKSVFEYAVLNDYIIKNPVVNIVFNIKEIVKEKRVLSVEEQKLFLEYAKKYSYYNLYLFLIFTGCRIGEALALTWDAVDFVNKIVFINKTYGKNYSYKIKACKSYVHEPKTMKSVRTIPMHEVIENMLHKLEKKNKRESNIVFHTKNYTNIMPDDVWSNIQVITKKINADHPDVGLRRFSAHALRHTFATNCFECGIDPKIVQSYMGHSSLKMTMDLYTHVSREVKSDEIKKLNKILNLS